jgi:hypothetical protein
MTGVHQAWQTVSASLRRCTLSRYVKGDIMNIVVSRLTAMAGFLLLLNYGIAVAIECPKPPEQTHNDWDIEISAAVAKIGAIKGGDVTTKTKTVTQDLLTKLPKADRVYLEQMMFSSYCSVLRDDNSIGGKEKAKMLREYVSEMRRTLAEQNSSITPKNKEPQLEVVDISVADNKLDIKLINHSKELALIHTMTFFLKIIDARDHCLYFMMPSSYTYHLTLDSDSADVSESGSFSRYTRISTDGIKLSPIILKLSQLVAAKSADRFQVTFSERNSCVQYSYLGYAELSYDKDKKIKTRAFTISPSLSRFKEADGVNEK